MKNIQNPNSSWVFSSGFAAMIHFVISTEVMHSITKRRNLVSNDKPLTIVSQIPRLSLPHSTSSGQALSEVEWARKDNEGGSLKTGKYSETKFALGIFVWIRGNRFEIRICF